MSLRIPRSLIGLVPAVILLGQTASAFADFARLEETSSVLADSSSEESHSSTSVFLIPGLLLAGGAAFGLGMGGSHGGGSDISFSRVIPESGSSVVAGTRTLPVAVDILSPMPAANTAPATIVPVVPNLGAVNDFVLAPSSPADTPVVLVSSETAAGNGVPTFVLPPAASLPPVLPTAPPSNINPGGNSGGTFSFPGNGAPAAVPEPSAIVFGGSLLSLGMAWRVRRKKASRA